MSTQKPFRIKKSALLSPVASPTLTIQGELAFDSSADVIKVRNSGSTDTLVQAAATQVLTNKTLTGNTAANLVSGSGTFVLNTSGNITAPNGTDTLVGLALSQTLTNKVLTGNTAANLVSGSGTLVLNTSGTATIPNATDTLVGKATTDTLTNKTFDADGTGNSITNIENADIKVGAAIDRTKLASGTASHVLINNGSGVMSSEAQLDRTRGGTGVSSTATFPTSGTVMTREANETVSGVKTHTGDVYLQSKLFGEQETDSSTTGANATSPVPAKLIRMFTNASLTSLDGVTAPASSDRQVCIITNNTGASVLINNETGTAANQIRTGTGSNLSLANGSSLILYYNSTITKWLVVGGSGSSGSISVTAGENLAVGEAVYISVGSADGSRTSGRAYKLDASNDYRIEYIGIVQSAATSGNPVSIQQSGLATGLSGLTVGEPVYASVTTPGSTQVTAPSSIGQWVIQLGIAVTTTTMAINPAGSATAVKITSSGDVASTNTPDELSNLGLSTSVSGNALTISLKNKQGYDPTAGSPVIIGFRDATAANGTYNTRTVSSALSMTVSSGSTLGHTSGATHYIWVYAIDNAGTVELACSTTKFEEGSTISTSAEGGAGGADSGSTVYSTTARTTVPFRILGRLTVNQVTAGTWALAASQISLAPNACMLPDPIIARYTLSNSDAPNSGVSQYLDFETKGTDTHGAVVTAVGAFNAATGLHATSEWTFTAPRDGFVNVSVDGQSANYTVTADTNFQLVLETNSSFMNSRAIWSWNTEASVAKRHYPSASYGFHIRKGQTIRLYMTNGHGSALNIFGSGQIYIYMNSDGR